MLHKPSFIFLSEPQLLQCDASALLMTFSGCYSFYLNSEDLHIPELALENSKTKGGTMIMWQTSLDPYITIVPTQSSSIAAILLKIPGQCISAHLAIYLPTSGQEVQFVSALASLDSCLEDLLSRHEDIQIFIRGDANVNPNNVPRSSLFNHFTNKFSFLSVQLCHPTYHHFLGNGAFDSTIDVLLHSNSSLNTETLSQVICKLQNPLLRSHHDIILSSFSLAPSALPEPDVNIVAPKIDNNRVKIIWSPEGITQYQEFIGDNLERLRDTWCDPSSQASMSVLLSATYSLLSSAAIKSNKPVSLSAPHKPKPRHHPTIIFLQKDMLTKHKTLARLVASQAETSVISLANLEYLKLKKSYDLSIRKEQSEDSIKRDEKLNSILSNNPSAVHKAIKSFKNSSSSSKIHTLHVGNSSYVGSAVPDGFYASLSSLKSPDLSSIHSTPQYQSTLSDYQHILKICRSGSPIPDITPRASTEILITLKAEVNDFYSITANHFVNAGRSGFAHFHFLLEALIKNVNLAGLDELNTIWACILHKGHGKDKQSDRSYRTISTCPLLAKALDTYVGSLHKDGWASVQASTQFSGSGSSHELAALLLTEAILHSLYVLKLPLFILLLDAKSAFDKVVRECAIRNAYLAGTTGHGLLYLDSRLRHRKTFVEWDKVLMGPIEDSVGVEQGGVNSDKIYKLCNNVQLSTAEQSGLGVNLGTTVVSSLGFEDDAALMAHDLTKVGGLLRLTEEFCQKYHVELVPDKTKLLVYAPPNHQMDIYLQKLCNPLKIAGHEVDFSPSAEHVGILRSPEGNMPNILSRLSSHTRAIMSVLPTGMAFSHRGNPAAGLRLEKLYGTPVLLSGLPSLVLTDTELSVVHNHHKTTLQRVQRLLPATPECVVMFLAGSLPATGILHLRMLGLLGMIARLGPTNILHQHGRHLLLSAKPDSPSKSWFLTLRQLSAKYGLPDPLLILQSPPSAAYWKTFCKSKVIDWHEQKLRGEANLLPSLPFFNPRYMSLSAPHPIWTSANSPYEVSKAVIASRMLSGRYRTDKLSRHWVPDNPDGLCRLPGCSGEEGNLQHILLHCPALSTSRANMIKLWSAFMVSRPNLLPIIHKYTIQEPNMMLQLLLDATSLPLVISSNKLSPGTLQQCLYLGRTWCFSTHIARTKLFQQLNIR